MGSGLRRVLLNLSSSWNFGLINSSLLDFNLFNSDFIIHRKASLPLGYWVESQKGLLRKGSGSLSFRRGRLGSRERSCQKDPRFEWKAGFRKYLKLRSNDDYLTIVLARLVAWSCRIGPHWFVGFQT